MPTVDPLTENYAPFILGLVTFVCMLMFACTRRRDEEEKEELPVVLAEKPVEYDMVVRGKGLLEVETQL